MAVKLPEDTNDRRQTIDMQERADSHISVHHVVPLVQIPERRSPDAVGSVYMSEISNCNSQQIPMGNRPVWCPDAYQSQQSQQKIYIAEE